MFRKIAVLGLVICLVLGALAAGSIQSPALAQGGGDATTNYALNMRAGPGADYDVVAVVDAGSPVTLEARSENNEWVLGRTLDGAHRGWLASLYLSYTPGFSAFNLAVSNEVVAGGASAPPPPAEEAPAEQPAAPAEPPPDGGVRARTNAQLNVRSGPGTNYDPVGLVNAGVTLVLEAQNLGGAWVLGHTEDGQLRGWLSANYLAYLAGNVSSLPFSDEVVAGGVPGAPGEPGAGVESPNPVYQEVPMGPYDPARIQDIDLTAYPAVGRSTARARQIFLEGRAQGNNPNVIAKVGDCSSQHWYFLRVFGWGRYNLGQYTDLQGVVNHFGESLGYDSAATSNGFNVNVVGGPEWADPSICEPGESPLECEYRRHKPSVAVIMFGTSDLLVMTPYEFDFYLHSIVDQTIERGIIPVVSTFPGNLNFWNRTLIYNQIVVRLALDYDIPLINLWLALEDLPNHGLLSDGFHLSEPITDPGDLSPQNLQAGYPMRNLVTLQTLNNIWREAMQ